MEGKFVQLNLDSRKAKGQPIGYVIQEDGCWKWYGHCSDGYGVIYGKNTRKAHRWMYEMEHGPISDGLFCYHLCDKKDCVNPSHMKVMTQLEYSQSDAAIQATAARMRDKTHCAQGHPFSGKNLYTNPAGKRKCRVCLAGVQRNWQREQRKKALK